MKLMIDIPEEIYEDVKEIGMCPEDRECRSIISNAIHNGTPIPENATNLDIAKRIYGKEVAVDLYNDLTMGRKWWNSPYKRSDKE